MPSFMDLMLTVFMPLSMDLHAIKDLKEKRRFVGDASNGVEECFSKRTVTCYNMKIAKRSYADATSLRGQSDKFVEIWSIFLQYRFFWPRFRIFLFPPLQHRIDVDSLRKKTHGSCGEITNGFGLISHRQVSFPMSTTLVK